MQVTTTLVLEVLAEVESIIVSRFSRKLQMVSKRVDIEDVLQEVRLRCVTGCDSCKAVDVEQLRYWVLNIAKYVVESMITKHRALKRSTKSEGCVIGVATDESRDGFQPAGKEVDPAIKAEVSEECAAMLKVISELTTGQATAIRMLYLEGASYEQIAATLNTSVSGARNLVDRGIKAARQILCA